MTLNSTASGAAVDTRQKEQPDSNNQGRFTPRQQDLITWGLFAVILVVALVMRLYSLEVPFDRDSYDEGVYWQSLRAMSAGGVLYQDVFYSQPPFFLPAIYPFYLLFGQTLWAARMGIVIYSLLGFFGAFLLGKALAGRRGALMASFLLLIDPLYLFESQTLQAEMPAISLSLIAVGLAFLWWQQPTGWRGLCLAFLTTCCLTLSVAAKLLTVPAIIPIALLAVAHIWRTFRQPGEKRLLANLLPLFVAAGASILTALAVLLPFIQAFPQMWDTVVTFHHVAAVEHAEQLHSSRTLFKASLKPIPGSTTPLGNRTSGLFPAVALAGTCIAIWRRDWRVLPLLGWLLATLYLLYRQLPLFPHHIVAITPPAIALVICGFTPVRPAQMIPAWLPNPAWLSKLATWFSSPRLRHGLLLALLACILGAAAFNAYSLNRYYRLTNAMVVSDEVQLNNRIARDLEEVLEPERLVITDALFIAGLADADTPPALVDISSVRISSDYVTTEQLIQEASQPEVQAVLYASNRLHQLPEFYEWVRENCRMVQSYGENMELWVKIE